MIPTIGTPSVNAAREVEVPVDDMGGNAFVRVDFAVAATAPGNDSFAWQIAGTVESPSTVTTPALPPDVTAWIRASGRTATDEQASSFTEAVEVTVDAAVGFDSITVLLVNRVPSITWEPTDLALGVSIDWEVHAAGVDPGSLADSVELDASTSPYSIAVALAVGEAITITVTAWSGWTGSAVSGDAGEVVTATLVPVAHAVTLLEVRRLFADYTLAVADAGSYLRFDVASGVVLTVPTQATAAIPVGALVRAEQANDGPVVIVPETSIPVLNALDSMLTTAGPGAVVQLVKVGLDEWTISGDRVS